MFNLACYTFYFHFINLTAEADLPCMLVFFADINSLVYVYQYVTVRTRLLVGSETSKIVTSDWCAIISHFLHLCIVNTVT